MSGFILFVFFFTFLTFFTLDLVIFIFPDNVSVRPFSYTQNRLEQNHRGCYAAIVFKCRTLFILAFSPPNKQLNNSLHITGLSILSHLSCLNWERGSWGIVTHHISALMWPVSPCLNPCALALSCTSRPSLLYVCVCVCVCQVTWFCRMTCCNCADADTFNCEGRGRRGAWGGFSQHVHAETLHSFCGWPVY